MGPGHRILGLHHLQLAIPTAEEHRAEAFYSDSLGLSKIAKPAHLAVRGGCWLELPGAELHLGVEEPFSPARKAHPAFLVEGLRALRQTLEAAGCVIVLDTQIAGYRRFYTSDPFGNRLEFLERVANDG